jgi:glutathione S-transferase
MQQHYVPPVYGSNSFNCPNCFAFSQQNWYEVRFDDRKGDYFLEDELTPSPFPDLGMNGFMINNLLAISLCYQCGEVALWIKGEMVYPRSSMVPLPNPDMPEDVEKIYNEAREVSFLSPRASAALLRLALEMLLPQVGAKKAQLLNIDDTQLIENSIVEHLPRVPILIDPETGAVICDVLAISEYLEENFKDYPSLLSDDIVKRSDIRVFSSHIHADLLPLMSGMSYANSFRKNNQKEIPNDALEQLKETLELLENTLARKKAKGWTGEFLFGDFSLADAMFAPIAQQIRGWNIKVNNYLDSLLNRESIKLYLEEAKQPYKLLEEAKENSPTWIARHYRIWEEIRMIHNCENDVYHILEDDVGLLFFNLAFKGYSKEEIAKTVLNEYDVDEKTILKDIEDFFNKIHPNRVVENSLIDVL